MDIKFVYWDDIYTNGKGRYCTEQYLINNFYERNDEGVYVSEHGGTYTKVENAYEELKEKTVRCNYAQLFHDNDSLLLCNEIVNVDECLFDNIEGGELYDYYDKDGNEITYEEQDELGGENGATEQMRDIYQYYLINNSLADMLGRHTDSIIV